MKPGPRAIDPTIRFWAKVNHLSVGTYADNNRDCCSKGRNPGNRTRGRQPSLVDVGAVDLLRLSGQTYREIGEHLSISATTAHRAYHRVDV